MIHQSNGTEPARSCVTLPVVDPGSPDVTDDAIYYFYLLKVLTETVVPSLLGLVIMIVQIIFDIFFIIAMNEYHPHYTHLDTL